MVIQIRGTSGSGKSYCVYNLLNKLDGTTLTKDGKIQGYKLSHPTRGPAIYALGKYETACGGCDTIKTQDDLCDRARRWAKKGSVVFEGLLCSNIFQRYVDLSHNIGGLTWAFMDTPLSISIARVAQRRVARGNTKPLNPANTTNKHVQTHQAATKALEAGELVIYLDHKRAADQVFEMLTKGTLDGKPPKAGYRYDEGRKIALGGTTK